MEDLAEPLTEEGHEMAGTTAEGDAPWARWGEFKDEAAQSESVKGKQTPSPWASRRRKWPCQCRLAAITGKASPRLVAGGRRRRWVSGR